MAVRAASDAWSGSRRSFLISTAALAACARVSGFEKDERSATEAVDRARRFLRSLHDPALGLLPEFRGSKVYWLYHDNYLAAKVLERSDPALTRTIRDAITSYGVIRSGKIEILFGEAGTPLPFHHHKLVDVRRIGDKLIRTEEVTDQVHTDWRTYADLLFLAAIARVGTDPQEAGTLLQAGLDTWDGTGIADRVQKKSRLHATYKLALARIAMRKLDRHPGSEGAIRDRLMSMQREDGGFVTDYDAAGRPIGEANVETTCMAILALE